MTQPEPDPTPAAPYPPTDAMHREEVRNEQQNDTPSRQEELTGESVTAPDDTLGG